MSTVRGHSWGGVVVRVAGVGLALLFAGCGRRGGGVRPGPALPAAVRPAGDRGPARRADRAGAVRQARRVHRRVRVARGQAASTRRRCPRRQRDELRTALERLFGTPAAPLAGSADVGGLDLIAGTPGRRQSGVPPAVRQLPRDGRRRPRADRAVGLPVPARLPHRAVQGRRGRAEAARRDAGPAGPSRRPRDGDAAVRPDPRGGGAGGLRLRRPPEPPRRGRVSG